MMVGKGRVVIALVLLAVILCIQMPTSHSRSLLRRRWIHPLLRLPHPLLRHFNPLLRHRLRHTRAAIPLLLLYAVYSKLHVSNIVGQYNGTLVSVVKGSGLGVVGFMLSSTTYAVQDLNAEVFALFATQDGPPTNIGIYNVTATDKHVNVSQDPLLTITPNWVNATDVVNQVFDPIVQEYPWLSSYLPHQNYYSADAIWMRTKTMDAPGGKSLYDVLNDVLKAPYDSSAGILGVNETLAAQGRFSIY